jgi:hypothetical protein
MQRFVTGTAHRMASSTVVALLAAAAAFAGPPQSEPIRNNVSLQPGVPAKQGGAPAKGDFRLYLQAARAAEAAKKAYAAETGSLEDLLTAQQAMTDAEIEYARATAFARGDATTQQYMALRREVSTLERSVAEVKKLVRAVPTRDKEMVRAEVTRYETELEQAKVEFAKASTAWRTAQRSQQFQHLNGRGTIPR